MMSTSLAAKRGSRECLKVRSRCGCSLCARQMRCTEPSEMPMALAIARPVQWVAWCGGSVQVSATTRAVVSAAIGGLPGLRVLSRSRPSTPLSAKRCCQRHTVGRLTPTLCATRCADCRSAEASTMCPLDVLARPVAVGCDRRQLLAIRGAQNHTYPLCHMADPPKPWPNIAGPNDLLNLLNDSKH